MISHVLELLLLKTFANIFYYITNFIEVEELESTEKYKSLFWIKQIITIR